MKESFFPDSVTHSSDAAAQMEVLRKAHSVAENLKRDLGRFRPFDPRYGELAHMLDVFQGIAEEKMTDVMS